MNYQHRPKGKLDGQGTTGSGPYCSCWKELATPWESQSIGKEPCSLEGTSGRPTLPPDNDDDEGIVIDMNFNCSFNKRFGSLGVILKEI